MVTLLMTLMFIFLFLNFPMMIPMVIAPLVVMVMYIPNVSLMMSVQQLVAGVSSAVLLSVPMFMLAADIMCAGKTTRRLLDFVQTFVGHVRGGMAITTAVTCTIFGAISGATMATLVAVGKPTRGRLLKLGYSDSDTLALISSAAIIDLLIPPSISMIMYCVVTGASVGQLFIAGVIPGIMILIFFAIFSYFQARMLKIPFLPRVSWADRLVSFRKALAPLGFPVIIFAGIYSGFFSPVEAAAVAVLYAIVLEMVVYRSVSIKQLYQIAISTSVVTCAVYVLVAGGQLFSWVISYAKIPQMLVDAVLGPEPTALAILIATTVFFFVGCMFVDSLVVIIVLSPIFYPVAMVAGVHPIHLGIVVTLQAAAASVIPPFGCNIFTASAVFNRPYLTVIRGLPPYILILIFMSVLVIFFPQISLFLLP